MHAVGSLRGMNHMTNSEYQFLSGLDKSIIMTYICICDASAQPV